MGLLLALHGCGGSSSSTSVAPSSISRCSVSVTGGGSPIPAGGGTGTLTVTVDRECAWSARSESPWISLTGGQGQGPATITFSVQPNPNGSSRRGSVAVDQQKVEIAQDAAPCRFDVSPSSVDAAAAGGAVSIEVSAPGGCSWTAQSANPWLTVEPRTGQGSGTVQIAVAPNGPAARSGSVTVAGAAVHVRQPGASRPPAPPSQDCRYDVEPTRRTAEVDGDQFRIEVKARAGCGWTAASQAPWIIVASGASETGNGEVRLVVAPNIGESRTGTATVAGTSITIQQDGIRQCNYTVKPTHLEVRAKSDDFDIEVKTRDGCRWTASSPVSWVTIKDVTRESGDGKVRIRVEENRGPARSTTLVVAGQPFSLTQEAPKK